MPNLDGIEATAAIRADDASPNRSVPIFALSASSDVATRTRILSAGLNSFISKPVTLQLRVKLETYFEHDVGTRA